ncbi:MAG: T9SS type A sorting domain-containing protein [Bacteroidales bacterium]|nr:T9SS type A sorting domain-containing protein [Bacteroidales bacterium]
MKKALFTILICLAATSSFAGSLLIEGFEYANHDMTVPIGWTSNDQSWLCGYLEKDHNRIPHSGNWYAYANAEESWMFMPISLLQGIQYRFKCWAISDGSYTLEFWTGPSANVSTMHTLLLSATIESGEYEKVSSYVESIVNGSNYIGIRAVAADGASYLTIDDLEIDQVEQYEFLAQPISSDTVMYPGTQASFDFLVQNLGYEGLRVYMSPSHEYFDNIVLHFNNQTGSNFHIDPDSTVYVTATATLKPDLEPGSMSWLDITFTIPCDCATGLVTFWVTPMGEVETFPLEGHFDQPNFMQQAWIVNNDPIHWEWADSENTPVTPYGESDGMLHFKASETNGTSLLFSPKMQLNETDNLIRLHLYRTAESGDKNDCVNVYFNTEMSLRGAQLLGTLHQSVDRSPATEEEGWYEYNLNFDCADPVGFIIIEGVGDMGSDLYLDEVMIDNTPLTLIENSMELSLYPNPTTDFVQVEAEGLLQVTVMDLMGRTLFTKQAQNETASLDLSTYEAGMYIINAISKSGCASRSIVKK